MMETEISKKIDLTLELARLLVFTAKVATAIRMYSAYNQSDEHFEDAPLDLMFLSDCLHNFDCLGYAIAEGSPVNIVFACDLLLNSYRDYQIEHPQDGTRQSKRTFDRNASRFSLNEGMAFFVEIRSKAASLMEKSP